MMRHRSWEVSLRGYHLSRALDVKKKKTAIEDQSSQSREKGYCKAQRRPVRLEQSRWEERGKGMVPGRGRGPKCGEPCASKLGACILFRVWGIVYRKPIIKEGRSVKMYCSILWRGGGGFLRDGNGVNRNCWWIGCGVGEEREIKDNLWLSEWWMNGRALHSDGED